MFRAGVGACPAAPLDGHHRAGRSDGLGQGDGEQSGAGEEVGGPLADLGVEPLEHAPGQDGSGTRVHLPEHPGADVEPMAEHLESGPPRSPHRPTVDDQAAGAARVDSQPTTPRFDRHHRRPTIGRGGHLDVMRPLPHERPGADHVHPGRGDGAGPDQLDVVGAVAVESHVPITVDGEPDPGPPPEAVRRPVELLDVHDPVDAGQPAQLLRHQRRLESPLGGQRHMLPVASPAPARPGMGASRLHPVG